MKKLVNQVINEIFKQMTITLTLPLDVPVRPMDAKGLTENVAGSSGEPYTSNNDFEEKKM